MKDEFNYLSNDLDLSGLHFKDSLFGNIHVGDIVNSYPHSPDYEYETNIELIDFEAECKADLAANNGFIVEPSRSIKKDLKAENGIFSPKFGQTLQDVNPFIDRYKCSCGKLKGRINAGMRCPSCGKICRFVDDNFNYFGWMVMNDHQVIHPAFYKKIEAYLGKGSSINGMKRTKLDNILDVSNPEHNTKKSSTTGNKSTNDNKDNPKDEPFFGIGMIDFIERFDEIMDYYLDKKPNRIQYYQQIMQNKHMVFTHCLPVFTTLLRPFDTRDNVMSYEPTNAMYTMMNKLVTDINKNNTRMQREKKTKNQKLYNLQKKFMELYAELENILSGKKGDFRCLLGGRYNFSSRCVIVQNPDLRIDEIKLSTVALTILLEQRIKNILHRFYNMQPADAHNEWFKSTIRPSEKIKGIIRSIINDYNKKGIRGIPIIINRNPSISYGSILCVFCIDYSESYSMEIALQPLPLLAADFDGDVLNILLPINETFIELAWQKFNPRNVMYISRNDGYFNSAVSMQRDTLINANTLSRIGRDSYTDSDFNNFQRLLKKKEDILYGNSN